MKPFHTIAIPHKDILEGKTELQVYAADLWNVFKNQGTSDYKDSKIFFERTYFTRALEEILNGVGKKLKENAGDSVIPLQTPFGGGKTHTLIALFHKAMEWKVKTVVIVGDKIRTGVKKTEEFDLLSELVEEQLTGSKNLFKGNPSPGGADIEKLLKANSPALIMIDEIIPYLISANSLKIGNETLASNTLTFLDKLCRAVSNVPNVCLVLTTTPSNPYSDNPSHDTLIRNLQNIVGRLESIKTPVNEDEVPYVIRKRLFSSVNEKESNKIVKEFIDYCEKETIMPAGKEPSEYRREFENSYPFMPEVIEVLYKRWGTFAKFQRTRGLLRILSLVLQNVKNKNIPYISISDFDLAEQEIRQEFIKVVDGDVYHSVINADITANDSGSKKAESELGNAYKGLHLAERTSTAIFLYSFSGGEKKGIDKEELKRIATPIGNPSAVVADALDILMNKLFFLQSKNGVYYFSNQPNLNKILINKLDNVKNSEVIEKQLGLIKKNISGSKFKVFIWPDDSSSIPDNTDLKLIILKRKDNALVSSLFESRGSSTRINRNTLFFLFANDSDKAVLDGTVKNLIAHNHVLEDETINLSDEQRKELKKEIKNIEDSMVEDLRRAYRIVYLPSKDDFKEYDLGMPTYGDTKKLDVDVFDALQKREEILERIAPLVIKNKYLRTQEYVITEQLYTASLRTPGEIRYVSKDVVENAIREGVRAGVFGLGELIKDEIKCHYFKQSSTPTLSENEIIIRDDISQKQTEKPLEGAPIEHEITKDMQPEDTKEDETELTEKVKKELKELNLRFNLPKGKASEILRTINYIQQKFNKTEISIRALDGTLSEQDYENKILEALRQLGINLE